MPVTFMVPINEAGKGESQTIDVVELTGTKKQRVRQWRAYLRTRAGITDVHKQNAATKSLGFEEILRW